ncbi:MAG: penicillin acylase family protein [Myxococcaceae bacterium]
MRIAVFVLVLLAAAAVVAVVDVRGQLPDRSTPRIPGLEAPVEVRFDARGVPTVRARSLADAMRVEGFLQARERLFQMELARRVAGGEVSALVGAAALPLDRRQRVLGFAGVADEAVRRLPAEERLDAQALADGINAFIASHRGRWGLEFQLLGLEPRPWTPADSIRVLLLMHQQLSESWEAELTAEALAPLPAARRSFLLPEISTDDVLVIPDAEPPPAPSTAGLLTRGAPPSAPLWVPPGPETLDVLGIPLEPSGRATPPEVGSNGWVIAGAHTASGKPILANDPHLGFTAPETWYPLRIELLAADGSVQRWMQGVSLPGLPGLVIFQNDRLAIGFTNTGTDVQDTYREAESGQRVEHIAVKDGPAETLTVSLGRHGPMVRPGLALHWAALDPSTLRLPVRMMLATDWASFNAAADGFLGPGQNVLYADVDGHIGFRAAGVLPLRAPGDDGRTPLDGSSTAHDWSGYLPASRMPRMLDPPSGRVVTANQRLIGTASGFHWPSSWASPTRARRITELVSGEGIDARAVRAMQLDTVGLVQKEVVERLAPLLRPELSKALAGWDGRATADSRLFRAAEQIRRRAYEAVAAAALQGSTITPAQLDWYDDDPTLLAGVRASPEAWRRAGLGERDAVLGAAVRDVSLDGPAWGEENRLKVRHPFGRTGGLLGWVFNPPAPRLSGCDRCVRVATPRFGQSMRFVVDLADPEATTLVLALGVSGHVWSPHRTDAQRDWLEGDLEGHRTRLHAPAVGPSLVFSP